ncbi:MAG: ABC transporter ATP-binding protein [Chloroflexi bacterium]|uniref:ABC transporter ATP-binding protein n=1 Tax=Candidatus Flexifilum breve TaxID=3140694 RepID=UPI0031360FA6|nr:ABC transporter ATP-binding protein [Chloroflexota bacterium]
MMGIDGGRRLFENEASKAGNVSSTLRRFGGYFRRNWFGVVIALVLVVTATWTQVASPDYIGQAVDCYLFPRAAQSFAGQEVPGSNCWFDPTVQTAVDGGQETLDAVTLDTKVAGLTSIVFILLGLFVLGSVMNGLAFYAMGIAGQSVLKQMRQELFRKLQRLSMGYYAENEVGNVMSRVTSDTDTIQQVFSFALLSVIGGVLLMVWIMFKMLQANWVYALISLSIVPVMYIATVYFSNQARKAFRKSREQMGSVNAGLQESIAGVREVQAFNREEESIDQFKRTNAANRDANVRAASFTSALNPVLEALGYVALGLVVVVGGLSVLRNEPLLGTEIISLGTVFAFLQYIQRFNQPITQIAVLWANIQSAVAGGERIFGLLDTEIEIEDQPNAKVMPQIQGRVEFDHVQAGYKSDQPVLKGVDFVAETGQMVAIVGPTGAGKTTIINLIPRFYDVMDGVVRIDGIDVRTVTQESLRQQIGIVLQDTFLFSDTVMNNIRYGRLGATDEEVIAAAKVVAADTFIERLPESYQTVLGERGSGLSQGQRQLIAIARVALMNPRILILDEATSSVDTRTERLIQKAFEQILKRRTSFVIAHRLSTIRNANLVMMLKDGEIIERGTHQSLLEKRGAYYDLYMSQFRREEEPEPSANGSSTETVAK